MADSEDTSAFAVASGKGGVGKTTTVVNLGAALAEAGFKVAIVDVDLGMANLGVFVGLTEPRATIHDVLAGEATLDAASHEAEGLTVVPGSTNLDRFAAPETERLGDVVKKLKEDNDFVLLDVGAGLNHDIVMSIGVADAVILVSTADLSSLTDTSKTGQLVERLDRPVLGAVFTRTGEGSFDDVEDIAAALGTIDAITGSIPFDERVQLSIRKGVPLVMLDPESKAARAYRRLGAKLVETLGIEPPGIGEPDYGFEWVDPESGRSGGGPDPFLLSSEPVDSQVSLTELIEEANLEGGEEAIERRLRLLDKVRSRFS